MTQPEAKILKCYCDHCPNNTCTIDINSGLCYAEWRPLSTTSQQQAANPPSRISHSTLSSISTDSEIRTTTASSSSLTSQSPSAYAQTLPRLLANDMDHIELERRYNCYNKADSIMLRNMVCNETVTNTSHVIRRCCNDADYCNSDDKLLPEESRAMALFSDFYPQQTRGFLGELSHQYSNLPLGVKLGLTVVAILLLVYTTVSRKGSSASSSKRRRKNRNKNEQVPKKKNPGALKKFFSNLVNYRMFMRRRARARASKSSTSKVEGHHSSSSRAFDTSTRSSESGRFATPTNMAGAGPSTSTNAAPGRRKGRADEEFSENLSSKANSVFDTNSMASREPLLNNQSRAFRPNQAANVHPLYQHHPGPHMTEETFITKGSNLSYNMTMGSGLTTYDVQDEASSGSGAGQPYLTQRSIANDIELSEIVGRGYYGVVWRGEYKGEPVAVKIFSSLAEHSWEREAEIYQTTMLRHKNILGFIATDKRHDAPCAGYWLVTDYYPMGSLYDFLKDNTMGMADAVKMAFSIANGLSHLHVEIFGTRGKPAIAHRDMKSKNILVKNDGTCCISDLGMAVRFNSQTGVVDVPTNTRVGTKRYLAPEILDNKLNVMDFDGVKAGDIYALGLTLWELLRRTCLLHPSSTDQVDPNFSYSMDQNLSNLQSSFSQSGQMSPNQTTTTTGPGVPPVFPTSYPQPSQIPTQRTVNPQSDPNYILIPPADNMAFNAGVGDGSRNDYQQFHTTTGKDTTAGGPSSTPRSSTPYTQKQHQSHESGSYQEQHSQGNQPQQESMDTTTTSGDEIPGLAYMCESFELPFMSPVDSGNTIEQMHELVVVHKARPPMSTRWSKFASMRDFCNIMTECWYEKPQARLSALRVKKSFGDIARKYFNMNMEYD